MREGQYGDWYGRIHERVVVDPYLLPSVLPGPPYWPNEWHPPKTVEARELLWIKRDIPAVEDVLSGVLWFRSYFGARPTVVYCDSYWLPNRFQDIEIYGPIRGLNGSLHGIDDLASQMGLTRR